MGMMNYVDFIQAMEIKSPGLHELESVDPFWYVFVDSEGMVNVPEREIDYFKNYAGDRKLAYKLSRFGNGPVDRIAFGTKERE